MYQPAKQRGRVFYPGYGPGVQHKLRPFNVGRNKTKRHVRLMKAMERHVVRMRKATLIKMVEALDNKAALYKRIGLT